MIHADGLTLKFSDQIIFDKVSFSLQKGEKVGFIGRNGSGKSTLFRLLANKEEPDEGTIVFPKGYRLGFLEQMIHFSQETILEEAALGLPDGEGLYKVESLLFGLGFTKEMMDESPHSLSGGYQLRLQLAKVLASEPDCLLLDEPTNYLDILSIRFLSKFLKNWKGEMILISHDLEFLDQATTHMMCTHRHNIYKIEGKSADLFHLIAENETRHESMRQNIEKKKAHMQEFVDRLGAKASKAKQAQARVKMIDRLPDLEKLKQMAHLDFNFHEVPFNGRKMLEATHMKFSYDDEPLIEDFSLTIEKGDRIAIIGKNGFGKSTLLKLLIEELKPLDGHINLSQATRIGYFGQTHIDRLHKERTIEDEISSSNPKLNFTQVRGICGLMMFGGDLAKKPISVLSGGERSRVLLGKIIAEPCNLLLLDEPTHHLDVESIEALIDAIEEFDGSVVIVTHSEWILRRLAFNKLVICHKHKQEQFLGNYEEFLEKIGWQEEVKKEEKAPKLPPPKKANNKSEIKKCEDRIMTLEENVQKNNAKLAAIAHTAKGDEIKKLLSEIEKDQKEIEMLYTKLEHLYN